MQVNFEKNAVWTNEVLLNSTSEQGFESDIILPDYCPDIARILKCTATPKIARCYYNLGKVECDGTVFVSVYYLCSENKIHSHHTSLAFSKTVAVNDTPDTLMVRVTPKTQYVNCRAVSSRRLDIRGAIELKFSAVSSKEKTLIHKSEDETVQLKTNCAKTSYLKDEVCRVFSVNDEFNTDIPVTNLLRYDATVYPTEYKVIANKIIVKGEMALSVITQNDECETNRVSHLVPISQIIDMDALSEESVCSVNFDVVSLEVTHRTAENGTAMTVNAKISVCVSTREESEIHYCDDAYSITGEVECKSEKVKVTCLCEHIDTKVIHRHRPEIPDTATVIDLWYHQNPLTYLNRDGFFYIESPITIMYIYKTADGECQYGEENFVVSERREKGTQFDGKAQVCECVLNGNEAVFSVRFCGDVLCENTVNAICDIAHTDTPDTRPECALTIYFSQKGESVWDIAKRYRTKAQLICLENGIETEQSQGGILVIPTA